MMKSEESPKKFVVDLYTKWCGWCKKMDKDTFQNPEVAAYMSSNFYMVKTGDSLWSISNKFADLSIEKLKKLNNLTTSRINPGQKLRISL